MKMFKDDKIKFKVVHQGAPIVNGAVVYEHTDKITVISVDLRTKWCEIDALTDNHGIYLVATNESTSLKTNKPKDEPTKIEIKGFDEYEMFMASISRYTLKICMIKK